MEIVELYKELKKKDEELKEFKKTFPFELKLGDKLISIIFSTIDQQFYFSMICKNTDIFAYIVSQLFNEYPKYKEQSVYFISHGEIINEYKTLEENKIKNSDIIYLNYMNKSSSIEI